MKVKGQVTSVEYVILGLVLIAVVLSGTSIFMVSGISVPGDLDERINSLTEGQADILEELGKVPEEEKYVIGVTTYPFTDPWVAALCGAGKWYAADHNFELKFVTGGIPFSAEKQVEETKTLIETTELDGYIYQDVSATLGREIADLLEEKGIPLITIDCPVDTSKQLMAIGGNPFEIGYTAGVELKKIIKNKFEPIGEVEGKILIVSDPPSCIVVEARNSGFKKVFEDCPGITIDRINAEYTPDEAKMALSTYLGAGKDFDFLFCPDGVLFLGVSEALKSEEVDMSEKAAITVDAHKQNLEIIGEGYMDLIVDHTPQYHIPVALKLMRDYLEGKPLPKIGDVLTPDTFDLTGNKHYGYDIWEHEDIFMPAEVVSYQEAIAGTVATELYEEDFPFLSFRMFIADSSNYDDPVIWSNYPVNWEEQIR